MTQVLEITRDEAIDKIVKAIERASPSGTLVCRSAGIYPVAALEALGLIKFDGETPERQWCFLTADMRTSPAIKHSALKETLEANGYSLVDREPKRPVLAPIDVIMSSTNGTAYAASRLMADLSINGFQIVRKEPA